jgi:protein phosphatase
MQSIVLFIHQVMSKFDLSNAIEMVACSDTGRVRRNNEDAVFVNPRLGLAILADGMGGHNAGEVASNMVITALGSELEHAFRNLPPYLPAANDRSRAHEVISDVILRTNAAIHMAAQNNPRFAGMGTTLVAVQFYDDKFVVAHVGDSRLYRLRDDFLTRLTRDHSLLQEQIDKGMISPKEARFAPNRNLVTRALGVDPSVDIELNDYQVLPGDLYLLCSDGLNDMAEDNEIAAIMTAFSANLQLCARQLVEMANEHGGRDNVSVILVKIREGFPASRLMSH